jgi:hypothetical protein
MKREVLLISAGLIAVTAPAYAGPCSKEIAMVTQLLGGGGSRRSRPMTWNEVLPISIPTTAISGMILSDMACSFLQGALSQITLRQGRSTAGPSH